MRGRAELANGAWESLLGAHAVLMKAFAASDIWSEVTMKEYDVLYTLSKAEGPMRLSDLHRRVLLSQPALSRMVDRLVFRGLVEREIDPADRRGVLLTLTRAGLSYQRKVGRRHARDVATAMSVSLSDDELARLEELCQKLAAESV